MRYPDFLVIGAPKSGTTSLHAYVGQHPDVFLPEVKEPHFFCSPGDGSPVGVIGGGAAIERTWIRTVEEYEALFADADGRLTGESSTTYLMDPAVPPRVVDANPDVRVIAVLRDPVERAISGWKMWSDYGVETLDFGASLADADRRRSEGWCYPFLHRELGLYARQLAHWEEFVDPSRILVLLADDLDERRVETCQKVFAFLGVDDSFVPRTEFRLNTDERRVAKTKREQDALRVRHSVPGRAIAPLVPRSIRQGVRDRLARRHDRASDRWITIEQRTELRRSYRSEVEALQERYGFDLRHWLDDSEVPSRNSVAP